MYAHQRFGLSHAFANVLQYVCSQSGSREINMLNYLAMLDKLSKLIADPYLIIRLRKRIRYVVPSEIDIFESSVFTQDFHHILHLVGKQKVPTDVKID